MNLMNALSGQGFVMYNKDLAHEVGVNASIIFGQLCSSHNYWDQREKNERKKYFMIKDGKRWFYMIADDIQAETALTTRQQKPAIDKLIEAGYLEAEIMGTPAKKYFHITKKIYNKVLEEIETNFDIQEPEEAPETVDEISFDKSANLDTVSFNNMSNLALTKCQSKDEQNVQQIINNNNKQNNKDNNLVNKEPVTKDEIIDNLVLEYMNKGLSKQVCFMVVEDIKKKKDLHNFGGYLKNALENTLHRSQVKHGLKEARAEKLKELGIPLMDFSK